MEHNLHVCQKNILAIPVVVIRLRQQSAPSNPGYQNYQVLSYPCLAYARRLHAGRGVPG